jgi:hypothetical protein
MDNHKRAAISGAARTQNRPSTAFYFSKNKSISIPGAARTQKPSIDSSQAQFVTSAGFNYVAFVTNSLPSDIP